jgi:hypothetical protein|tara:strand:+ start:799 stop:990 length:192 start_codon:yes stop_codon:yes gene_type:complete
MPIWLRKYTFSEIKSFYAEEKKANENASSGNKGQKNMINPDGKINTPDFAAASKPYKGKTSYK